jgi:hypothetical protein
MRTGAAVLTASASGILDKAVKTASFGLLLTTGLNPSVNEINDAFAVPSYVDGK